ncbi:hypothetical protein [Paraglaciecola sp. 2405UD69-4]|uniref:hypothetical protein n=1 Tax=Paraglaciecola sp. 2405UD69-4 TaxID=3391836 RepID=UPI0039C96C4A
MALKWLAIIPTIPFLLVSFALSLYSYWPRDFSKQNSFEIGDDIEYFTISAHGVHDSPSSWSDLLQALMQESPYTSLLNIKQQNHSLDWERHSSNVFICSVAGRKLGVEIGVRLASKINIKGIHAVGHSCGSFVALGICEGAKSVKANILVQTTYLDPVSVYSGVFWDYGLHNFGTCADFSDSYIDTRDTVPGSNLPLAHAFTFDVTKTQAEQTNHIAPHAWPTMYYLKAFKQQNVPIFYNNQQQVLARYKKGEFVVLE